jgi:hypothetical protein
MERPLRKLPSLESLSVTVTLQCCEINCAVQYRHQPLSAGSLR